jgi:hypothetical protein
MSHRRVAAIGFAIAVLAGCGEEDAGDQGHEVTAFAEAMSTIEVVEPVGTGVGWVDVEALRAAQGSDRETLEGAATALGPGGDDFLVEARPGLTGLGFDPGRADQILSLNGSYTFGVRVDGVPARSLASELGEPTRSTGEWDLYDLAGFGTSPEAPIGEFTSSTGAYVAVSDDSVAFARSAQNRSNLFEVQSPASQADVLAFAADCLGDVSAARVLPHNFNYLPKLGPKFAALGVRPLDGERVEEVMCGISESEKEMEKYASELERRLAPDAVEPTTGAPIGDVIDSVSVDTVEDGGFYAARAEITLADGEAPGFVFRSFNRGSLVTFFGFQDPTSGVEISGSP